MSGNRQGMTWPGMVRLALALARVGGAPSQLVRDMDKSFRAAIGEVFAMMADDPFEIPWLEGSTRTTKTVRLRDFLSPGDFDRLIKDAARRIRAAVEREERKMPAVARAMFDESFIQDATMEVVVTMLTGAEDIVPVGTGPGGMVMNKSSFWVKAKQAAQKAMGEAVDYVLGERQRPPASPLVDAGELQVARKQVEQQAEAEVFDQTQKALGQVKKGLDKALRYLAQQVGKPRAGEDDAPDELWQKFSFFATMKPLVKWLQAKNIRAFSGENAAATAAAHEAAGRLLAQAYREAFKKYHLTRQTASRAAWEAAHKQVRQQVSKWLKTAKPPRAMADLVRALAPLVDDRREMLRGVFDEQAGELNQRLMAAFDFAGFFAGSIPNQVANAVKTLRKNFSMKEGQAKSYFTEDAEGQSVNILETMPDVPVDDSVTRAIEDYLKEWWWIDTGKDKEGVPPFKAWALDPRAKKKQSARDYLLALRMMEMLTGEKLGTGLPHRPANHSEIVAFLLEELPLLKIDVNRSTLYRKLKALPDIFKEYLDFRKARQVELLTRRVQYLRDQAREHEQMAANEPARASKHRQEAVMLNEEARKTERSIGRIRRQSSRWWGRVRLAGVVAHHWMRRQPPARVMVAAVQTERFGGWSALALELRAALEVVLR